MSGVSANCYGTKWHRRRGSNRNDVDDQKSRQSKPSCRANVRASDRVFGLWFVFARGSYARPPVSVAVPNSETPFKPHSLQSNSIRRIMNEEKHTQRGGVAITCMEK